MPVSSAGLSAASGAGALCSVAGLSAGAFSTGFSAAGAFALLLAGADLGFLVGAASFSATIVSAFAGGVSLVCLAEDSSVLAEGSSAALAGDSLAAVADGALSSSAKGAAASLSAAAEGFCSAAAAGFCSSSVEGLFADSGARSLTLCTSGSLAFGAGGALLASVVATGASDFGVAAGASGF